MEDRGSLEAAITCTCLWRIYRSGSRPPESYWQIGCDTPVRCDATRRDASRPVPLRSVATRDQFHCSSAHRREYCGVFELAILSIAETGRKQQGDRGDVNSDPNDEPPASGDENRAQKLGGALRHGSPLCCMYGAFGAAIGRNGRQASRRPGCNL